MACLGSPIRYRGLAEPLFEEHAFEDFPLQGIGILELVHQAIAVVQAQHVDALFLLPQGQAHVLDHAVVGDEPFGLETRVGLLPHFQDGVALGRIGQGGAFRLDAVVQAQDPVQGVQHGFQFRPGIAFLFGRWEAGNGIPAF